MTDGPHRGVALVPGEPPVVEAALDVERRTGRTLHVVALGWFTQQPKVLSSHFSPGGPMGADAAAAELVRQGFASVELYDSRTGRRYKP